MKISVYLLLFVIISFSSCKNDDYEIPKSSESEYLPVKINHPDYIFTFKYDTENRLIEMKSVDSEIVSVVTSLTYEGDELISVREKQVSSDFESTQDYIFTYQNNKVSAKISYTDSNGVEKNDADVITIDEKGDLINYDGTDAVYDVNGNLKKITNSDEEYTFEYDSKNGIFRNVKTQHWIFVYILNNHFIYKLNNAVKINYKDLKKNTTFSQLVSYTYNSAGYPAKIMVDDRSSNSTYTSTIQYNK